MTQCRRPGLAAALLLWTAAASAQNVPPGAPAGGRPTGMGRAYSALAADGYAPLWNPAGLGSLGRPEAALSYGGGPGEKPWHALSAAFPLAGPHGAGIAAELSPRGGAYTLAYGRGLGPAWSLGAGGRYLEGDEPAARPGAFAVDVAVLRRLDDRLGLALVGANLGGGPRSADGPGGGPAHGRLGAGYSVDRRLAFSLETVLGKRGGAGLRTGLEVSVLRVAAARVGVDTTVSGSDLLGLTAGFGLSSGGRGLDFSYIPRGARSLHQLSLVVAFGRPRSLARVPEPPARPSGPLVPARPITVRLPAVSSEPAQPAEPPRNPGMIWLSD